jgi:hypothetical protein
LAIVQAKMPIPDLIGKGKRIRTVLVPVWAKSAVDAWITASGINGGMIFRRANRLGKYHGSRIWSVGPGEIRPLGKRF